MDTAQARGLAQLDWTEKTVTHVLSDNFVELVTAMKKVIKRKSLEQRPAEAEMKLQLREYSSELQSTFYDINAEWISTMFSLEAPDREVLEDPRTHILDGGGAILFVETPELGIIGTCALRKTGPHSAELTKMGVRAASRGLKAGELLLAAMIERAEQMKINDLYLLTNSKCQAAIHLYGKLGFEHDADVMTRHAARYQRCDVGMRYVGKRASKLASRTSDAKPPISAS